jgi:hypothetical protein
VQGMEGRIWVEEIWREWQSCGTLSGRHIARSAADAIFVMASFVRYTGDLKQRRENKIDVVPVVVVIVFVTFGDASPPASQLHLFALLLYAHYSRNVTVSYSRNGVEEDYHNQLTARQNKKGAWRPEQQPDTGSAFCLASLISCYPFTILSME